MTSSLSYSSSGTSRTSSRYKQEAYHDNRFLQFSPEVSASTYGSCSSSQPSWLVSPNRSDDDYADYDDDDKAYLKMLNIVSGKGRYSTTSSSRNSSSTNNTRALISPDTKQRGLVVAPREEPERKLVPRTVSPDRLTLAKQTGDRVYVAESMRGECFHASQYCDGLRKAHGVISILRTGAELRGKRACRVCRPADRSLLEGRLLLEDRKSTAIVASDRQCSDPLSLQKQVYVAASLKGQCFHSYPTCEGLRTARGVTTVPADTTFVMHMRPCTVCSPSSGSVTKEPTRPLLYSDPPSIHDENDDYLYHHNRRLTNDANPPSIHDENDDYLFHHNHRLTSYANPPSIHDENDDYLYHHNRRLTTKVSYPSTSSHTAPRYWVTPSGQCYHTSRNCTSLRRSKTVLGHTTVPSGKRACSNCC